MNFVITARKAKNDQYSEDPGPSCFLEVPDSSSGINGVKNIGQDAWVRDLIAATPLKRDDTGVERGDVLVFIHGFNNTPADVLARHRILGKDLATYGFQGSVVSFDWPCGNVALAYLEDRHRAKLTAYQLVTDCIALLARMQATTNCKLNIHLLGHSTGAYVIREAFDDADEHRGVSSINWTVSQLVLIAGDVSATSMGKGDADSESTYRHCVRLTNYSNPFDEVLQISNVKRAGFEPRVGRVGLPSNAPDISLNVNCGEYYQATIQKRDPKTIIGVKSHSWYFGDPVFSQDLAATLNGDLDRHAINTRQVLGTGQFKLVPPQATVQTVPQVPLRVQSGL
jgi:esterase/lipase superfamily enzyme